MATDDNGDSKGYGYVHYETGVSANMAIAKINGMLIAGKQVILQLPCRYHPRPFPSTRNTHQDCFALVMTIPHTLQCFAKANQLWSRNFLLSKLCDSFFGIFQVHVGHFVRRDNRAGQADWTNLYVKGLPEYWDDAKLREEFGKHGAITRYEGLPRLVGMCVDV